MKNIHLESQVSGTEHWTKKGDVDLFLWNKFLNSDLSVKGTILFVHGSSMASQPTFDLHVNDRPFSSAMNYFASQGYDTWCVDMEGYGKSSKHRDITCDIDGSVPTTIRSSTIKKPNYYLDRKFFKESKKNKNNISVMAVDNLPSELPKESSIEFGENIINHLLPYLIDRDDGRVLNATITENGYFLKKYNYLNDYLNS